MVHVETFEVSTGDDIAFVNLTAKVEQIVRKSGVKKGAVTVQAGLCVDSITQMEFEPGSQQDLKDWLDRYVPTDVHYVHEYYNQDDNGHSHLRGTMFGASESFVIDGGEILLNTWQQIILIGFSPRGGQRKVHVAVMGE
jgi:secondary thiamine-phosphate synthase enzyme